MRDYKLLAEGLRYCSKHICNKECGYFETCHRERGKEYPSTTSVGFDAADAIEELVAKVPHWISVEERLPEDQGDDARAARGGDYIHKVLAASVTPNYTVMDTAYLENGIWSLSKYTSWKQIIGAPVTHWMPLPTSPGGTE